MTEMLFILSYSLQFLSLVIFSRNSFVTLQP